MYQKKYDMYASLVGIWVSLGIFCKVRSHIFYSLCVGCSDFGLELHSRGWYVVSERVRVSQWGRDGLCRGVMVTVCPVLAPLLQRGPGCWQWNDITEGGPLSPFLGALKFCTQRLRGAPISTSEWTQHFWKSLTRLNHSAISCQSTHTSCFSELTLHRI